MRHFSVLLMSAPGALNLKKNDQPLVALPRAATLKLAKLAKARLKRGIATAAILLLTIPPITDAADARGGGGGGGGRGGGFGGHTRVGGPGFSGRRGGLGFSGRSVGGARPRRPRIWDRPPGARPFSPPSLSASPRGAPTPRA